MIIAHILVLFTLLGVENQHIKMPVVFCNGIHIPDSALGISFDQLYQAIEEILERNETISVIVSKMDLTTPICLRLEPSICLASLKQEISFYFKVLFKVKKIQ